MIFYCLIRESSAAQRDKYGPAAQRRAMERFAGSLPDGPHIVSEQNTVTVVERATAWVRDDWAAAVREGIRRCKAGICNAFVLPRVDRETRNLFSSIPILKQVLDAGIPVYFAEEEICLTPNDPEAIERYLEEAMEAAAYIRRLVKNTKPGRIARSKDDQKLPTNCAMFGFDIVDGRRIVNQAQAAALRQAGEIILQEGRSGSAARWLNSHGWHTTRGRPFRATSVVAIFRNPALIGETTINFKEETVVIRHQAILDEATFQAINAVLDGHRLREPRGTVLYALRGIAYCKCGAKLEPLNNGRRYYRCKARCGGRLWRKDELEFEVADAFTRYLEDRERRQDYLLLAQKSADSLRQDLAEVNKALERNKSEWIKLLQKDLCGYPRDVIEGAKTGLQAEAQALERQKCQIEADLAALPQVDPAEVERELMTLAEPWSLASGDGRINAGAQHVMSWQRRSVAAGTWRQDTPHKLSNDEAQLLRETLLRVDARVIVQRLGIRISGRLSLRGSAKTRPSSTI